MSVSICFAHCSFLIAEKGSCTEQAPASNICWIWFRNYIFRNTKPFLRKIFSSFLKRRVVLVCAYKNLEHWLRVSKKIYEIKRKIVITVCWYIMPHPGLEGGKHAHPRETRDFFGDSDNTPVFLASLGLQCSGQSTSCARFFHCNSTCWGLITGEHKK